MLMLIGHYEKEHGIINKVPLAQINDKFFYTFDGLLSFIHGHPNLESYYAFVSGKTLNEVLQNKNVNKKLALEREALRKNQRLYTLYQIYNSNNRYVINHILKTFKNV